MAMAASEAQKRAMKNYAETEKGQEARREAVERYQETEQGQAKLKEAQERFEASEKRKAYRREWDKNNRPKLRKAKKSAENSG
jgi:hypothetical protein